MKRQTKYEYIRSFQDYRESLMRDMDGLGYPLRKQVKRDRYVLNARGFEEALNKAIEQTIKEQQEGITKWIDTEVMTMIEENLQDVLNNINVVNNNFVVKHTTTKTHKSHTMKFAEELAKAIGKSIGDILEDTIFPKGKY